MTSRDAQASYYDITLPDGTRTEVWSVLRAVLSPEEALGYVKACILTRIMRDGRKDTDRQREADKVGVEAGMLREAMEAYLATPDPMTAALDAVDMMQPRAYCSGADGHTCDRGRLVECDEHGETDAGPCPHCNPPPPQTYRDRIAELERELPRLTAGYGAAETDLRDARRRIEELERERDSARVDCVQAVRERDEARQVAQETLMQSQTWQLKHREAEAERDGWRQTAERAQPDLDAMRKTLEAERQAAVATAEELERVRRELADLRETYDAEMEFRAEMRRELGANVVEGFDAFLRRVCRELADLRERYRPRRQSEEPAPTGQMVLRWDPSGSFWRAWTEEGLVLDSIWTHQPPAPEGE